MFVRALTFFFVISGAKQEHFVLTAAPYKKINQDDEEASEAEDKPGKKSRKVKVIFVSINVHEKISYLSEKQQQAEEVSEGSDDSEVEVCCLFNLSRNIVKKLTNLFLQPSPKKKKSRNEKKRSKKVILQGLAQGLIFSSSKN